MKKTVSFTFVSLLLLTSLVSVPLIASAFANDAAMSEASAVTPLAESSRNINDVRAESHWNTGPTDIIGGAESIPGELVIFVEPQQFEPTTKTTGCAENIPVELFFFVEPQQFEPTTKATGGVEQLPVESIIMVEPTPFETRSTFIYPPVTVIENSNHTFTWAARNITNFRNANGVLANWIRLGELSVTYLWDPVNGQFIDFRSGPTLRNWNWGGNVDGVANARVTTTILNNGRLLRFTITATAQNYTTGAFFPVSTTVYHIVGEP